MTEQMNKHAKHEGIFRPDHCPRGLNDCESLDQIISAGHKSFMCCGKHDGKTNVLPQDEYRVCFKNSKIDEITDYDKRDLIHTAKVLMGTLAIIEERDSLEYHDDVVNG